MLEQKFQNVTGTLSAGGVIMPIGSGRVLGDRISFTAGTATYRIIVSQPS